MECRRCGSFASPKLKVPWSALNPVAEEKDRLVLEFGAERYRLELSSHDSTAIQQYLKS